MIFGPTEILICIVPVFIVIAAIGITLLVRNRKADK
jgi:hypothetical protein